MRNEGGVVIIREQRKPDILDVRQLVAAALDGFCEEFGIAGAANRRRILRDMSDQAREMEREIA